MLPKFDAQVLQTPKGTYYLREAGVVMLARPQVDLEGLREFLEGFDPTLQYPGYLADPVSLPPAEQLCKTAGQLCFMSFGPKRTWNEDAVGYFDEVPRGIKPSGHGSVFEHANFTFLLYGISRSLTHELVRHRAGFAFSQVSQRYVGGKMLRFVERPEYIGDPTLHEFFERRADRAFEEYEGVTSYLMALQAEGRSRILNADQKTELRKKVRQAARSLLMNETEAPIIVTSNVRGWRHFCEQRASQHAETEIRGAAMKVYRCLVQEESVLFGDYSVIRLPDGTEALETPFRKV